VEWTFGTLLWWMLGFFFWFVVIWMFIAVFASILRRDISGWAKAGWIILIVFLPLIGILIYLIATPRAERTEAWAPHTGPNRREYGAADEIAKAAALHDQGRISGEEYEFIKTQALGRLA
jgi:Phospholipase_D-nuclease N-terminal